jgi:hypothetical protein
LGEDAAQLPETKKVVDLIISTVERSVEKPKRSSSSPTLASTASSSPQIHQSFAPA